MLTKKNHLRTILIFLMLIMPITLNAAEFSLGSNDSSTKTNKDSSNENKIIKTNEIIATGYGVNKEQSLNNAFKSAIQQFVGVIVDSETQIKNSKLIEDNIITASSGFVQSYDVLKSGEEAGLYKTKIKALVKSQKVYDTAKSLNIATLSLKNTKNIEARVKTKAKSKEEVAKILEKNVNEFLSDDSIKDMIKLNIVDAKVLENKAEDGEVPLKINWTMALDYDVYAKKIKKLEQIFENVGAKLDERVDIPEFKEGHKIRSQSKESLRRLNENDFFIIKKYGQGYKTDVWQFPQDYKGIYPLGQTKLPEKYTKRSFKKKFQVILEISNENRTIYADNITPDWTLTPDWRWLNLSTPYIYGGDYSDGCGGWRLGYTHGLTPFLYQDAQYDVHYTMMNYETKVNIPVDQVGNIKKVNIIFEEI